MQYIIKNRNAYINLELNKRIPIYLKLQSCLLQCYSINDIIANFEIISDKI